MKYKVYNMDTSDKIFIEASEEECIMWCKYLGTYPEYPKFDTEDVFNISGSLEEFQEVIARAKLDNKIEELLKQ